MKPLTDLETKKVEAQIKLNSLPFKNNPEGCQLTKLIKTLDSLITAKKLGETTTMALCGYMDDGRERDLIKKADNYL